LRNCAANRVKGRPVSKSLIYLDHAATTPLSTGARAAMVEALDLNGNPSSVHRAGRAARNAIDRVRGQLAQRLDVGTGQVIFTSGGTEANAIALSQVSAEYRFASAIEHEAVLSWVPEANYLPIQPNGVVDLEAAEALLASAEPGLVSVMLVNNVIGTIQPVEEIAQIAKRYGHSVHCDAVQAFGKMAFDFESLGVDMLSVSAHKIGGPKGVGALIVRDGLPLAPFTKGGGQERRRRPGTENIQGIIGLGGALSEFDERLAAVPAISSFAQTVEHHVGAGNVMTSASPRVPHIMSVYMPGVDSQMQLMRLDLEGICVSAGSACSSGKVAESDVIKRLSVEGKAAAQTVRISFGPETEQSDVDAFLKAWEAIRETVRSAA